MEHDGQDIEISSKHDEDGSAIVSFSGESDHLIVKKFVPDPDDPSFRVADKENDYYRSLTSELSSLNVAKRIHELPTPMFLDLDRRARIFQDRRSSARVTYPNSLKRSRNIFSFFLAQSIDLAADLAEQDRRDALLDIARAGEELREKLILDFIDFGTSAGKGRRFSFSPPQKDELQSLKDLKDNLKILPDVLGVKPEKIIETLEPTLEIMNRYGKEIPKNITSENAMSFLEGKNKNSSVVEAVIGWNYYRSHFNRVKKMVDIVKHYNESRKNRIEKSEKYLSLVNRFLIDSGKSLVFDDKGALSVSSKLYEGTKPINSLASGEGQLFVIITNLFFNQRAQKANVFIVDEPELSLHVQWQEQFVDTIMDANPNVQYILATHSPSIILYRIDRCEDLGLQNVWKKND